MSSGIEQLRERMAELTDLRHAAGLLEWDQQTMMPPRGALNRAEALATLEKISHDLFISAETGRLIEAAAAELNGAAADTDRAALVRLVRRHWEKARRVPTELAADLARAASMGQDAWKSARASSNFAAFAPYLRRNLELAHRYVECFDGFECPYDVLLDDYDHGTTTADLDVLFTELKGALIPLISTLVAHSDRVDAGPLRGDFPVPVQRTLAAEVVSRMGFDRAGWRIDDAVHPFAMGFGTHDVRITARWDPTYLPTGLYGAMHECGHGLYEAGVAPSLQRTPLGHPESLALHESQSRLWENMVGRGRAFCTVIAPRIAELFGLEFDPQGLYEAVNCVRPSYIRVEADEATYGLHIVVRFELERALIDGRLGVDELPEAWNERFEQYLGIEVPDVARGVLQDVHWSAGLIGYFPTYALGNLIAGQLWRRAHADLPDLDDQIAAGELTGLREWLREHVHRHGAKFSSHELLERVVGGPVSVEAFTTYLKQKLGDVYRLEL